MPFDSSNQADTSSLPSGTQPPNDEALVQTNVDTQERAFSVQEQEQRRLLGRLEDNQAELARLFAALPTFDTVVQGLLVSTIKVGIDEHQFRTPPPSDLDPDHCYVNHFTVDSRGARTLTSSQSFTELQRDGLLTDAPPTFTLGGLGFFSRPDSVDEADSLFVSAVDTRILRTMEAAFYIATPTTQDRVKRQFREALARFRTKHWNGSPDSITPVTREAAFADLLLIRFQHFFDLYKADRSPAAQLTQGERILRAEEDRLLDIITTHPSRADRSRLMRAPIAHVYAVTLEMGAEAYQTWPAAMVIKRVDRPALFLYSMERGLLRFDSFQQLVNKVQPLYKGQARTIRDIASELSGHVFEGAAAELLQIQSTALEAALNAPGNATVAVSVFAKQVEDALSLPMLSLVGPLLFRVATHLENNRPNFYKTATLLQQAHYRRLEGRVMGAAYQLGDGIQTLEQFARQKVRGYLQQTVHTGIAPDPDKTRITLFSGKSVDPRNSRVTSLTQLMLDNVRSPQYPNAMREISTVYLVDKQGERIRHPATGAPITLAGDELARMATTLDVGGNYEILLRKELNKPGYKAAWQAAYLANMKFKRYEATLRGSDVFRVDVLDKTLKPPKPRKQLALWLRAILESPSAEARPQVSGRQVHVYALLLGGGVGVGGQNGTMGDAVSIDGALIFTDQDGPVIKGTVGVYFPDSPKGQDLHEFSDLSDGVTGLLQQEEWQTYFRSRIASADQEEIKKLLGQHRSRPLIRGLLITGDFLEPHHRAHVNFHSAYADHRSTSNREIRRQTALRVGMAAVESVLDLVGLLFTPGFRLLKSAVETGYRAFRTGIPMDLKTLLRVHNLASRKGRRPVHGVVLPLRGQPSAVAPHQRQGETSMGLPLEEALYRRYAVTDASLIQGVSADAQGFYRPAITDSVTGSVTRPVYVRQPDGTVFRVHDHTRLNATEATLVDPSTGLSIRSSGVMRSTVARMPDGEWRAVGFGQGGGKRPGETSPQPGPSKPKRPAMSSRAVSDLVRTPGIWDEDVVDLIPAIMTRLPSWPQNRSLLIMDEIVPERDWSVRFTPGQVESVYPMSVHPDRASTDIVLRRIAQNHYSLILPGRVETFDPDGDCFFNAIVLGLSEGQAQGAFSMQGLRNAVANYIDQHPELSPYLPVPQTATQRALLDRAPSLKELLGRDAFRDLTRIVHGDPNPHHLFQPTLNCLRRYADHWGRAVLDRAQDAIFPPEILQAIGRHLSPRAPGPLDRWYAPLSTQERLSLRSFLEDVLLEPVQNRYIDALLDDRHLALSHSQIHIMLEYGVTSGELSWNYPINEDSYVLFDEAIHGHLDEDELEEFLDGASLVTRDDLDELADNIRRITGRHVDDDAELLGLLIDFNSADRTRDLYRMALARFPALRRRAAILLESPIISWTLGDRLSVALFASWLRNPALSDARLRVIARYADTRYQELLKETDLDIDWMTPFDDRNVQDVFTHREALTGLMRFLNGASGAVGDVDMPAVAGLFRLLGHPLSNSRVALLFNAPGLWDAIQRFPQVQAQQIWSELIGPYFTDVTIQRVLGQTDALSSELNFARALGAGLSAADARANQIVRNLFGLGQSRAQQYLYNFDFPTDRLGHSRLDFALHLESHLTVPEWAWQYAREGVTPDSLRPFGEAKPKRV